MSAILNPSAQEAELEASLGHTVRLCLKTDHKHKTKQSITFGKSAQDTHPGRA